MPERYEIRGQDLPDGNKALSPKDIYNINKNFSTIGLEVFGNADFTKKIKKEVDALEIKTEAIITTVGNKADSSELENYSTHTQTAELISSRVSTTDFNGNTIASLINQSATTIDIEASKINLNGLVTANENFKILLDGSIEAKNGKFTGEINTTDVNGRAVRIFKRNLVYYSPTNQDIRGMISSASYPSGSEGMAIFMPEFATKDSVFSIGTMSSFNDITGDWVANAIHLQFRRQTTGRTTVTSEADVFQVSKDFNAPRSIQSGTIVLNASTATTFTFPIAMQGAPTIVLTPMHSITGAVITAKLVSTSTSGFSAIIQGSPTGSNVTFYWIAMA